MGLLPEKASPFIIYNKGLSSRVGSNRLLVAFRVSFCFGKMNRIKRLNLLHFLFCGRNSVRYELLQALREDLKKCLLA